MGVLLLVCLPAAAAVALFGSALFGSRVFAPGDVTAFLVPFGPVRPHGLLAPANPGLADVVTIFEPLLFHAREAVRSGSLPLWDPSVGLGRPLGAQQGAPLFPLSWLAYVLPFWRSLAWIACAKIALAFTGTFLLARHHRLGRISAAFAASAFAFSSLFISFLSVSQTNVAALLPWALLAADRLAAGGWRRAGSLGLVLGVALYGGHPETWFVLLCGAIVILSARGIQRRRDGWRPLLLLTFAAFTMAALVGALYLLPFAELLTHAARATRGGAHPDSLRRLIVGLGFPEWWGRTDKTVYDAHVSLTTASSLFPGRPYLGVAPLLAAVASLAVPSRQAQRFYLGLGAAALALMIDVPGLRQLVTHVPPFSRMNPHYFVWLASLSLAMLGGLGLEAILRASRPAQLRALRAALTFVALTAAAAVVLKPGLVGALPRALGQLPAMEKAPGAELASAGALMRWIVLSALVLLGAWWALRRPRHALVAAAGLLAFTAADLVTIDRGINPVLPPSLAHLPAPPAFTLASHRGWGRIAGPYTAAAPSVATLYGLDDVRVNDLPAIKRYSDTFAALGGVADFAQGASYVGAVPSFGEHPGAIPGARTRALLDLLGARFVIDGGGDAPSAPGVGVAGLGSGWRVLVDGAAFPRAWVAYTWRPVSGLSPAVQAIRASSLRALRTRPIIETTSAPPASAGQDTSPASVVTASDQTVTVQARLGRPGYLVLDDLFYPGWTATVDGHETPLQPADGLLRAVHLPAGRHAVRFQYDPASVRIGEVLTAAGLLIGAAAALAGLLAWVRRRRRVS